MATEEPQILLAAPSLERAAIELRPGCDPLDPAHCLFPFPNDFFTTAAQTTGSGAPSGTGLRVRFGPNVLPENTRGKAIGRTAWTHGDGFSPGSMLLTYVPGLDLEASDAPRIERPERSLEVDSPILVVDAESGERHPIWAELDSQAPGQARQALILRPTRSFVPGRRYLVVLRALKDTSNRQIEAVRTFAVYRDRETTKVPEIEERRPAMEGLLERLARFGIERNNLYLTWDFTVASERNLNARLLHMRDDAFAALGDAAPSFEVFCEEDERAGDGTGAVLKRVWGSYEVPSYLTGRGTPGSRLALDSEGLPRRTGTFTAYFSCLLPASALDRPAQPVLYGHGLLNSLDEVDATDIHAMVGEHGFAYCATNWTGMSIPDSLQIMRFLRDASAFPPVADRLHQGLLNTLFLGRLMKHPEGLVSKRAFQNADGTPLLDTNFLAFDGNSQGTVLGGVATAISQDWTRAVLGVPGMNFSLILRRSADFSTPRVDLFDLDIVPSFAEIFEHAYRDPLERPLVIALLQMLWDRAELNGYAHRLIGEPYPNTPRHEVLMHAAFGDQAMPNIATEVLARTLRVRLREPALAQGRDARRDPYSGIERLPEDFARTDFKGSAYVLWDDGSCPTPLANTPPEKNEDPHGVVRRQRAARAQKAAFLRNERLAEVCGETPCMACDGQRCPEPCARPVPGRR